MEMANKIAEDDEYQLQYYGTTTSLLIKAVYEGVLDIIKKILDDVEREMLGQKPDWDVTACRNSFARLYREYAANTLVILQRLEPKLRQIFNVPSNVLLPHDKYQATQYSDKEVQDMRDELIELENEYIEKRTFKFLCQKELLILEGLQPIREWVDDVMCKIDAAKSSHNPSKEESLRQTMEKHNKTTNMLMEKLFGEASERYMFVDDKGTISD